jgi:ATP-dependent RNA helicase DeaD
MKDSATHPSHPHRHHHPHHEAPRHEAKGAPDLPESPQSETETVEAHHIRTFADLKLSEAVLNSLNAAGFLKPTPIQGKFIPLALTGRDVMGQAKTGTGKTGAFLIPIFERIKPGQGHTQALILAPTRELAMQIHGEITRLGAGLGFTSITIYGGASYEPQIEALASGVDIIVGTPGRIMDHMNSHRLHLTHIQTLVLDEADRMLDLGFRKDIEYILKHCPARRQTLLLSATIPEDILKLSKRYMYEPLEVWTAIEKITVDSVEQHFYVCDRNEKLPVLLKLLDVEKPDLAIVFCATKMGARRLAERLKRVYINAREIHGDLHQSKREKIMGHFRTGKVRLLIATDVASRGIDVHNITHIFNYDIPYKIEDYVHRVGRTGRMEKAGKAYTLVTREEGPYLTEIEQLINREIQRAHFDDLTSKWWPNPPTEPDGDFEPDEHPDAYLNPAPGTGKRRRRRGRRSSESGHTSHSHSHSHHTSHSSHAEQPAESATSSPENGADGAAEGSSGQRSRRRRGRREPSSIVCSQCGATATIHFKPNPNKPVYCETCYALKKGTSKKVETVEAGGGGDTSRAEGENSD